MQPVQLKTPQHFPPQAATRFSAKRLRPYKQRELDIAVRQLLLQGANTPAQLAKGKTISGSVSLTWPENFGSVLITRHPSGALTITDRCLFNPDNDTAPEARHLIGAKGHIRRVPVPLPPGCKRNPFRLTPMIRSKPSPKLTRLKRNIEYLLQHRHSLKRIIRIHVDP